MVEEKKGEPLLEELDGPVLELLEDLQYNGFDPVLERHRLIRIWSEETILKMVTAYVQLGNNVNRAISKVRKQHSELVTALQVAQTRLARVGICFMPLTYAIRKTGVQRGKVAARFTNTRVPSELQDVAFQGWLGEQIKDFLVKFSAALSPTRKDSKTTLSLEDWMSIAEIGFKKDVSVAKIMRQELTYSDAKKWLLDEVSFVEAIDTKREEESQKLEPKTSKKGKGGKQPRPSADKETLSTST